MRFALPVVSLLVALSGCDAGGLGAVGAPCNTADDCEGELICDEHNGQASCQSPHGHGEDGSSTGAEDGSTTGSGPEATETSAGTTTGAEASTGESESSSTGSVPETGADDELCVAFCSCMASTCAEYEAYPYADEATCLSSCEAMQGAQLQCFGGFCQQAMISEGTLAAHYCEHAWGELGDEKC